MNKLNTIFSPLIGGDASVRLLRWMAEGVSLTFNLKFI